MKKIHIYIFCIIAVFVFSLTLASCSQETVTINVYNWGEYISDGSEDSLDVNAAFTEATGIKVNYTTYSSNEDLYAKLKSGATGYDVIIPSDYMVGRMIDENMLEKIDFSNIPNYQYIDSKYKSLYFDPTNEYSVPYTVGLLGVIYNSTMVDEADVGSWGLMWNEKYSGKILTINNPRDAFGTAQFYLGLDVNSTDESEWRIALNKLTEQKPLIQSYVMDEIFNKMEGGEAAISTYYAGDFLTMYSGNNDLAFYYPEEGTNIFVDSMCIPKGSEHKAEAEMYINFMLQKDIAIANAEYIMYASPNTQVYDDADYISYISEYHENAFDILYSDTSSMNVSYYHNLPADTLVMVNNLWEELKVDSSTGNGIYIICGIIVLAGASLITYKVIQKKKRSNY